MNTFLWQHISTFICGPLRKDQKDVQHCSSESPVPTRKWSGFSLWILTLAVGRRTNFDLGKNKKILQMQFSFSTAMTPLRAQIFTQIFRLEGLHGNHLRDFLTFEYYLPEPNHLILFITMLDPMFLA